jgi:hypothetical protein
MHHAKPTTLLEKTRIRHINVNYYAMALNALRPHVNPGQRNQGKRS